MKNDAFQTFRSSLLRCLSNLRFLERFYDEFINASPEIAKAFSHTNMERQKAMMNASLYQLMNYYGSNDEAARKHIQTLGAQHGVYGHKIPLHLYDVWLDSLIIAVRESDPKFDPSLEAIWREVMTEGIEVMKASSHLYPPDHSEPSAPADVPRSFEDELRQLTEHFQQSAKEAAHRSDFERDIEVTAFQFGQYRAYMHVYELLRDLMDKYKAELRHPELNGKSSH